jgi:hypothetical protein
VVQKAFLRARGRICNGGTNVIFFGGNSNRCTIAIVIVPITLSNSLVERCFTLDTIVHKRTKTNAIGVKWSSSLGKVTKRIDGRHHEGLGQYYGQNGLDDKHDEKAGCSKQQVLALAKRLDVLVSVSFASGQSWRSPKKGEVRSDAESLERRTKHSLQQIQFFQVCDQITV